MPDSPRPASPAEIEGAWHTAHNTAHRVREALLAIGVPEAELGLLTARASITGAPRVILPTLSLESTELLLRALDPAPGPHLDHHDTPVIPAGHPA